MDYTYNIRGWLTSINNPDLGASGDGDLFGMRLYYNDITGLNNTAVPATSTQYNGNIAAMVSGIKFDDSPIRGYGFDYDGINRLKTARYGEGTALASAHGKFNVTGDDGGIRYDKNGNIKKLQRYHNGTLADNLTYTYENNNKSNRLQKVTDPSGDRADMADYVARTGDNYTYDHNGNMKYDPAKEGTIKYNYLNLPERVDLGTQGKIYYHYDAAGNKLAKYIENSNSSENTTTEYIANLVYTNGQKSFFSTEEGRAIPIVDGGKIRWHYEYNLKDHLGNTRVTFGGSNLGGAADIVQTSSYYPFGMVMAQKNYNSGGNSYQLNKYLYNGKELQDDVLGGISLDWYDYGARCYDPALGRFHTIDPLLQYDSPYTYCGNNPIVLFDPTGMWAEDFASTFVDNNGNIIEHRNDGDPRIYYVDDVDAWRKGGSKKSDASWTGKYEIPYVNYNNYLGKSIADAGLTGDAVAAGVIKNQPLESSFMDDVIEVVFTAGGSILIKRGSKWLLKKFTKEVAEDIAEEAAEKGVKVVVRSGANLVDDVVIQFGKNQNQIYHAFRHTDDLGLDRALVQSTIQNHFKTVSSQVVAGKPFNQIVEIGRQKIQYTAFKLSDGTVNIGRIHGIQ